MRGILFCALVLCSAAARADFILTGSEHREVTLPHDKGILFDSSTAEVKSAGSIAKAYVNDEALLRVPAGSVTQSYAYGNSSVDISGGTVRYLNSYNTSITNISNGSIYILDAYNTSTVNMSGGSSNGRLSAYGTSTVNISGGLIGNLYARENSSINISGGSVNYLYARDTSSVDISGGSISNLEAYSTSSVTLYGHDFRVVGGLRLEDKRVLGTGMLIGKWFDDETPWIINIANHGSGATIMAIPEPSTLVMLLIAAIGFALWRRRN